MNTSPDRPGFATAREALAAYCPTTPRAAEKFLTTLEPRDFESLVTAALGGRNQEQTRALVLVAVAEIAAGQALTVATLAGMGVGRLAAEHSVEGRPADLVNQACELARHALDCAFAARTATLEALAAADAVEVASAAAMGIPEPAPQQVPISETTAEAPPAAPENPAPTAPPVAAEAPTPEPAPPEELLSEPVAAPAAAVPAPEAAAEPSPPVDPVAEPAASVAPAEPAPEPAASGAEDSPPAETVKPPRRRPTLSG